MYIAIVIKGDATKIRTGLHMMNPQYRLVLTATPIKNRRAHLDCTTNLI